MWRRVQKKSVCLCFGCVAKWHPVTFPDRCACVCLPACVCVCQHPAQVCTCMGAWLPTFSPVDPSGVLPPFLPSSLASQKPRHSSGKRSSAQGETATAARQSHVLFKFHALTLHAKKNPAQWDKSKTNVLGQ